MKENKLVSIIMPAYNVGKFIEEAIQSIINQTYTNWELLIVDDGSTDDTRKVVCRFDDTRINYFHQDNKGVGAARNLGLQHMTGDFFCFLDGDDVFPPDSLKSRVAKLISNPSLDFVDGVVVYRSENLENELRRHNPSFHGEPYDQLLRLNPACLFGNTWMVRKNINTKYKFKEGLTHAEDLYFYLTISQQGGNYSFVNEEILWYRQRDSSAMKNLKGLEKGYRTLYLLAKEELHASKSQLRFLKYKITRIMFASYLIGQKNVYDAVRSLVRNLTL